MVDRPVHGKTERRERVALEVFEVSRARVCPPQKDRIRSRYPTYTLAMLHTVNMDDYDSDEILSQALDIFEEKEADKIFITPNFALNELPRRRKVRHFVNIGRT